MCLVGPLPRLWLLALACLSLVVLPGCLGCGGERGAPEGAAVSALRRSFPEQAGKVLEQAERFIAAEGEGETGFVIGGGLAAVGAKAPRGVEVELPREAGGAIRFRTGSGGEIRIRESGVEGSGQIAERAVAYRRTGGTSFWAAVPGGVEEWLHLEAGVARAGQAVASWEVEGASARQTGEAVELVDAAGWARMRVTAPVAYAAGGRVVMARLAVREGRVELYVDAAGEAVLVDPLWVTTGAMSVARSNQTATLLEDGQVLVAGGDSQSTALASVELYDPKTNLWTTIASLISARYDYTATRLEDGTVLVVGGYNNGVIVAGAELYNPLSKLWTTTAPLPPPRHDHTAALLSDGKVLVIGGYDTNGVLASTGLYDPANKSWKAVKPLLTARAGQTETLLGDGRVLVVGGDGGVFLASAEIYDPVADVWAPTAPMSIARVGHTATLLGNKVLVVGGQTNGAVMVASAEIYDPVADTWAPAAPMSAARVQHTATLLGNGKVLVAGGQDNSVADASAELYDPKADVWTAEGSLSTARYAHTATLLASGQVLAVGGFDGTSVLSVLASAELYTFLSTPCALPTACSSGFCVDGVCCDTACSAGQCDACSNTAGAPLDGTCALLTGTTCTDGDACTQTDTCQAGTCMGANPVACAASTSCEIAGACDSMSGLCNNTAKPDDTPCPGGVCKAGVCFGDLDGDTVADTVDNCPTFFNPDQANQDTDALGDVCDDDLDGDMKPNAADNCPSFPNPLQEDVNQDGVGDACDCAAPKKDGDPCDDADLCTPNDTCAAGKCQPGVPVICPAPALCQDTLCLPATGACLVWNGVDGAPCPGGVCIAGGCFLEPPSQASTSSSGSSGGSGSSSSATGSGGVMGTSTGASASASSGMGAGGSAEAGAGGSAGEITFHGGACGVGRGPADGAPWIGLGLLLALRRRRQSARAGARRGESQV